MADQNLCLEGVATGFSAGGMLGVPSNINDDASTYYGLIFAGAGLATYWCIVEFDPATVHKMEIWYYQADIGTGYLTWQLDLFYDGVWHNSLKTGGTPPDGTFTSNLEGDWKNVTKIRCQVAIQGNPPNPAPGGGEHRTLELRAWGVRAAGGYCCLI